jgi:ABC-type multidrug transport system fused ATPase/permease subunit
MTLNLLSVFKMDVKSSWFYAASVVAQAVADASVPITAALTLKFAMEAVNEKSLFPLFDAVIVAFAAILGLALAFSSQHWMFVSSKKLCATFRVRLVQDVQLQSMDWHDQRHSGDIVSTVTNDVDVLDNFLVNQFSYFLSVLVTGIATVCTMWALNWKLAAVATCSGIPLVFVSKLFASRLIFYRRSMQNGLSTLVRLLSDTLVGMIEIRMLHMGERLNALYIKTSEQTSDDYVKKERLSGWLNAVNVLVELLSFAVILGLGIEWSIHKSINISSVVAIAILQSTFANSVLQLGSASTFIGQVQAILERISEVTSFTGQLRSNDIEARFVPVCDVQSAPAVEVRGICFSYAPNSESILKAVNLVAKKGEITAIVGPSGQGKSTLLQLIAGLYPFEHGTIKINGLALTGDTYAVIKDQIAYVPQFPYIYFDSVWNNIKLGRPEATEQEIILAAKRAYVDVFIDKLQDGYNTVLENGGAHLSGGQRQRIALARAFLKNASIILLDEPTSSLDNESEQMIRSALEEMRRRGKAMLVVAHRLLTIEKAEMIYVMERGTIVDAGKMDELRKRNVFRDMYDRGRFHGV